ncbi:hypothetical protein [Rodentibacter myodis]|nr:hypothetical protein [Rodentibacter myodis]
MARKIAQGRAELEAGKGILLEEAKVRVQATVEKTVKELDDFKRSVVYS